MTRRSVLAVVLAAVASMLAACKDDAPGAPGRPVNAQLVLAPGQIADVPGAGIRIRFQRVMGDSRCPADVVCIQGGDAIVRIDVMPNAGAQATYDLHTGNLQPVRHADLTIALVELAPYPFSSRPIAPDDYRVTLRITRS
jgi:hypothetical protein